jgi:hypothetical protein
MSTNNTIGFLAEPYGPMLVYCFMRSGRKVNLFDLEDEYLAEIGAHTTTRPSHEFEHLCLVGAHCTTIAGFCRQKMDKMPGECPPWKKEIMLDFLDGTYKFKCWNEY